MNRAGLVTFPANRVRAYRDAGYWGTETIPTALRRAALSRPDHTAVVSDDHRISYADLDRRTDQIAWGLGQLGLAPGDAVTLQVGNSIETIELWYGLLKAGVIPVCTLWKHRHHEIDEIARITGARAHAVQPDPSGFDTVTFGTEVAEVVDSVTWVLTIDADPTPGTVAIGDLPSAPDDATARAHVEAIQATIDPDDPAVFQLSGGTTSTPKIIPRLHSEYLYNVTARVERWQVTANDRIGYVLPLVHNAGVQTALHVAHSVGATLVLCDPVPDRFLLLFADEGVTLTLLPSSFATTLHDHPDFDRAISGMRLVALTLGRVPPSLFDRVSALGPTVIQEFGMGEGLVMTHSPDAPEAARRHTVGQPLSPADEVRLVDTEGDRVADGLPGVLQARGPYTLVGYLDAAERNAEAFTDDGFYNTGDVLSSVVIGGQRFYAMEGRTKDLINRGGEKINSEEVEALLLEHPSIVQAALVAMPDPHLGERACAFVAFDGPPVDLDEVLALFEQLGVARYKWPERLEVRDSLPRTSVGKIRKNVLREEIAAVLTDPVGG